MKTIYMITYQGNVEKLDIVRETKTLYILSNNIRLRKSTLNPVGYKCRFGCSEYKFNLTEEDKTRYKKYQNKMIIKDLIYRLQELDLDNLNNDVIKLVTELLIKLRD